LHKRELQADVKWTPLWEASGEWPRWGRVNAVWEKGAVDEAHTSIAKGNRAIEGYPILLGSIRETPQASSA
jgi:hypothetical protein